MDDTANTQRKPRMTDPAIRAELLREFHESGQTRKAFAATHGVRLSTLSYWLTCENRKALVGAAAPVVFGEVRLTSRPEETTNWAMEVISPEGLTVRSRETLPTGLLFRLLTLRRRC
jgi:transposase-like protein